MSYLGIDLGTSGLRALLIDESGNLIGSAERNYDVLHPVSGWSEQNPSEWILALEEAVAELKQKYSAFKELKGVGVAGQMHGATLLDEHGDVLRPCILWNDTRSKNEAAHLDQMERIRDLSGNIVFAGFTAPKLLWVQKHEPEIFKKVSKVLLPAAYINFYLTGEYVADMSDSAGTSWLDTGGRDWSDVLLTAGNMRSDQMPKLVEGSHSAGQLRSELVAKWGVGDSVIVAGGAGDNAAAACGIGALTENEGFVSLGTSGVLLVARDDYMPAADTAVHTFCHAVPDRWYQMGVMLSATDSLNWLSQITGSSPADLTSALGTGLKAPNQTCFLPYLSGERTPHNDSDIRGCFTGLATDTSQQNLTQSVLEGVAFGLKDSLNALKSTGVELNTLTAIGGGTKSRYWIELMATVLNIPLKLPNDGEFGAALGAARLALAASTGAAPETFMHGPAIKETIDPVSSMSEQFEEAYGRFQASYPVIKSIQ